jgi:hypothetical protein
MSAADGLRRMEGLVEVADRHSATIFALASAVSEVASMIDGEARERLAAALADADAQLAATQAMVERLAADLG